jgi:hypothetical protein
MIDSRRKSKELPESTRLVILEAEIFACHFKRVSSSEFLTSVSKPGLPVD